MFIFDPTLTFNLVLEYVTSISEIYPQSNMAWNPDAHHLLILANYMTFQGHMEGIHLANISDKWYFVLT